MVECRVKGRDWYDFIWYITHRVPAHKEHLRQRLIQTLAWDDDQILTDSDVMRLLSEKIVKTDFIQAKSDIAPFIQDQDALALWSVEFFLGLLEQLMLL